MRFKITIILGLVVRLNRGKDGRGSMGTTTMKKFLLGLTFVILVGVGLVGWRLAPIYTMGQEITPATAPVDYAQQDDTKVGIP